jgi:hypothetical protein
MAEGIDLSAPVDPSGGNDAAPRGVLDRHLCRVGGLNQNYASPSGTLYHIQIEDRGPVVDPVIETEVRRVNVIVYANYGEPNARIIHGRDHDFPDLRTHEHNRLIEQRIQALAADARRVIEEAEARLIRRIKALISDYHRTRDEAAKKEFEEANATFPFLFSRAWSELRQERARPAAGGPAASPPAARERAEPIEPIPEDIVYPLDPTLREQVLEIERMLEELSRDLESLRAHGRADDILVQTCRKMAARAEETLRRQDGTGFNARRLEMTRSSLLTTWRQVRTRLPR